VLCTIFFATGYKRKSVSFTPWVSEIVIRYVRFDPTSVNRTILSGFCPVLSLLLCCVSVRTFARCTCVRLVCCTIIRNRYERQATCDTIRYVRCMYVLCVCVRALCVCVYVYVLCVCVYVVCVCTCVYDTIRGAERRGPPCIAFTD
jgi:hypothetical protein